MPLVDYLLLTPLDEEWRTVRSVLAPKRINTYQTDPITYYLWKQPVKRPPYAVGEYLIVGASMFRRTGGESLATGVTAHGVIAWKPNRVVLVGIAGSLEPKQLKLGDVVVSDEIYGYEVGDAEESGLSFRPTFNQISALDFDRVRAFRNDPEAYRNWQEECREGATAIGLKGVTRLPELHLEAIASGNYVVKSKDFAKRLQRELSPQNKAVEMEARGLFQALRIHGRRTDVLMIRGISDYADENKAELEKKTKDAWRTFATANAARLLRTFWRQGSVQPISPGYELDLTLGSVTRFRQAGVPYIGYKRVGAQDIVFSNLLNRRHPTPELTLQVTAWSRSGARALNFRGICIIESPNRTILPVQETQDGILTFQLPASEWGMETELLLSFPVAADRIKVLCKDNFQRKCEKVAERAKRKEVGKP